MERFASLLGLVAIMGLAWLMSPHRREVRLRIVLGGLFLQFAFAVLILRTDVGLRCFALAKTVFVAVVNCVRDGTQFVFGAEFMRQDFVASSFAFQALPTIIFFSALMSLLYYYGVMQWIIAGLAWLMRRTLGTSAAETLSVAANIFVGQTEAPLVIRPYLAGMTQSELMTVMVGGFATVAGGVLAAYAAMGVDAGHLLTASVISAPAALLLAKIMQPEVERPRTLDGENSQKPRAKSPVKSESNRSQPTDADARRERSDHDERPVNAIHAVASGASDGMKLAINVAAMIVAFLGLIALVNLFLGWLGAQFGFPPGSWTLQRGLGYVFWPLAWLMGVETKDCLQVGQLLGVKMAANEFLAFDQLARLPKGALSPRSVVLCTYALCGFANFGSIGIQIGGIGPLAPSRRGDLARLGLRAMIGGTLAACMTACVVGVLI